ncbi:PREDICTED: 3-hydroxyisobutyryl-CoA hydrolase-like protein 5 [Camelina sativa]|uniref:3-hydroxyisobutyryl-CoA hydrolase n=1 Tax=Camelina sativa TaxID=90675 RepID=A0ABM0WS55_CAMSA|nr:PREDICTED: 3-hydroxyisobutyryl-CoA hydrolase-like protein 5 [Camelina sativa]XP_010475387.1 PREDICTED: 3-hydroxyisobutyryl-CoA hydrolase-like protein 5 [Camelina sativa]XP_010475388.1 PREDICTED: 3-hydroxyisobutyryl-CoA hydrolase-like protein 5 [Camelina sativa]
MAQQGEIINEPFVIGEEKGSVRLSTLNRPRQLNVISPEVVLKLAEYLEMWEKDDQAKLILIKGAGRAFSAGGDLKMFYNGQDSKDSCVEVVYRMYWLCYHIHTYKKTQVSLVNGISMGGGASLMVPMKFSVVTEKTVFSTPEASIGFHTDCGFSYIHSRLPGYLGEFLALTGARLNGKELVAIGMATHFVPSDKLADLEAQLVRLDSGDVDVVRSTIEEFSEKVNLDKDSILNKQSVINVCFSKESVKQIIQAFEAEASKEGNEWITPVVKGLKRSSPTGLKITLRSIREGRNQTLSDCLKKEFRLTMNTLRKTISADMYEGIRALTIDKDNSPKWSPATLDEVDDENINLMFKPLEDDIELLIPETEDNRWGGKYETSGYASLIQCKREEN